MAAPRRSTVALPALLLVCGLVAAWTAAFGQYRAEQDQERLLMARQTDLVRIATVTEAHRYVDLLAALAGALQAVPEVDAATFEPLRRAHLPGTLAVALAVPASTIRAHLSPLDLVVPCEFVDCLRFMSPAVCHGFVASVR